MAVTLLQVPTPGEEIRRARQARGISQAALAQRAGVSLKTISRIETNADYQDHRSIPVVRGALGLDDDHLDLTKIPAEDLAAEFLSRIVAADRILEQARIRPGDAPAELLDQPSTLRGPKRTQPPNSDTGDG